MYTISGEVILLFHEQTNAYLLRTPPNNDALRHSGGESLRWTSAIVTLYFDVELRSDKRPGTEQKTSFGEVTFDTISFPFSVFCLIPAVIVI